MCLIYTGAFMVAIQRLWTHEETAQFLGVSPATLHHMNYKRTGPRSFKVGRYRRYNPADVHAWLSERVLEPAPEPRCRSPGR
jgi:predicted DNA-binding transcriptional regulator AlpA